MSSIGDVVKLMCDLFVVADCMAELFETSSKTGKNIGESAKVFW